MVGVKREVNRYLKLHVGYLVCMEDDYSAGGWGSIPVDISNRKVFGKWQLRNPKRIDDLRLNLEKEINSYLID